MRDQIRNKEYFIEYIEEEKARIASFENKIKAKEIPNERIKIVKFKISSIKLFLIIAKYSSGIGINEIKKDFELLVNEMDDFLLNEEYINNLWILSLGILLNIETKLFLKITDSIDKCKMQDWLLGYLCHYNAGQKKQQTNALLFSDPYKDLQDITNCEDSQREEKLKKYVENKWYKGHKDCGWYNSHKDNSNTYFGYWSLEAGAIAKTIGINDASLINSKYYPFDLVHWND